MDRRRGDQAASETTSVGQHAHNTCTAAPWIITARTRKKVLKSEKAATGHAADTLPNYTTHGFGQCLILASSQDNV